MFMLCSELFCSGGYHACCPNEQQITPINLVTLFHLFCFLNDVVATLNAVGVFRE
jgi:hypothetical protein